MTPARRQRSSSTPGEAAASGADALGDPPAKRAVGVLRTEWSEIGPFGRVALSGVALSLLVTLVLGAWIPRLVRLHLLEARADLMGSIGDDIAARGLLPVGPPGSAAYERFAEEVEISLVGGETVRIKLWSVDGTIQYSDDPTLVGEHFGLTPAATAAMAGTTTFDVTDLADPAHANERPLESLIEFYVPVHDQLGVTLGLLEVEQRADTLEAVLSDVRRNLWLTIGSGIGLLGVFIASVMLASVRVLDQRRRQAERLLTSLFLAQEQERRRTVGALHDDVGQPLYRLLYGLEGARAKLSPDQPVRVELERLCELTRDIEAILRSELRMLHQGVEEELDLTTSLEQIVETTKAETDLEIELDCQSIDHSRIDQVTKTALVHAVREAVTNVRKHASATHIDISVERTPHDITVAIRDNGVGIRAPEGLGLATTRERLEALGGTLSVSNTRGGGTIFRARAPVRVAVR